MTQAEKVCKRILYIIEEKQNQEEEKWQKKVDSRAVCRAI